MREMKDSGVEWIDKIPSSWSIVPLKTMVSFGKGLPITKENLIEKGVAVVSYGQIHSQINVGSHLNKELVRYVSDEYLQSNRNCLAKKGDILIADTSEDYEGIGNSVLNDWDENLFAGYHTVIIRPSDRTYSKYLAYLFMTDSWRSQLRSRASGIKVFSVTRSLLKKTAIIIPRENSVQKITDYLDAKCSKINEIIEKQQAIVEKLKEYKLSVIIETVTKGLNPNVEMKDSGVEWIGQMPTSWDCTTVGMIATVVRGASPRPAGDPLYFNGTDVPWITVAEVTKGDGKYIDGTETFLTFEGAKQSRIVEEGTLLLSNSGATLGVPKITRIRGCINDGSVAFYNLSINQEFLLYLFKGRTFELRKQMQGYGQPNLNTTIVKGIEVPLPTELEQKAIVEFLDQKCTAIEKTIEDREKAIDKLQEYKKSLIYEVVTGKKEV